MTDPTRLGVAALQVALRARQLSALEIADAHLALLASSDLNAFLDVQPALTRAQARAADALLAAGDDSAGRPLLGVPVAHKDLFVTRGWRSTAGSIRAASPDGNKRSGAWPDSMRDSSSSSWTIWVIESTSISMRPRK